MKRKATPRRWTIPPFMVALRELERPCSPDWARARAYVRRKRLRTFREAWRVCSVPLYLSWIGTVLHLQPLRVERPHRQWCLACAGSNGLSADVIRHRFRQQVMAAWRKRFPKIK